jgi:hypothetical protein
MTGKHSGVAKLWLLNLFGNAALLAALYFWLLLPDAHGWQVVVSGVLALIVIFFGLWLRAGSFAYCRLAEFREYSKLWGAFRQSLDHLIALAICVAPLAAIAWWLFSLRRYTPQFGVWFWQKFSALRFASPRGIYHAADWALLILMAVLVALWIPLASTVAAVGLRASRIGRSLRALMRARYWIWLIALILVGGLLPYKLVRWIPDLSTLRQQAWSAGMRFFIAYIVVISAWVSLLLVVGERAEFEDPQPPTVL